MVVGRQMEENVMERTDGELEVREGADDSDRWQSSASEPLPPSVSGCQSVLPWM